MPFRNFISAVCVYTYIYIYIYIYIYDVILLWQLHAMKSFLDDHLYEGGSCHRSFWRLFPSQCLYVSSDTHFQNVAC